MSSIKVNIASKNPVKVDAVKELLPLYEMFLEAKISSLEVKSGVSEQPKSLEETIQGAVNRAKNAFDECEYSFGIESGIMQVPHTKTGFMDVSACAIYDGKNCHVGLSCAFEFPPVVVKMISELEINASDAFHKSGLTGDKNIGSSEGAIGLLTKGRVTRKEYTKQAIMMALIHLENPDLYKNSSSNNIEP